MLFLTVIIMAPSKNRRARSRASPPAIAVQGSDAHTLADVDSDHHPTSDSQLTDSLEELFPVPEYAEGHADVYEDMYERLALPRSTVHKRYHYKARNFATLPKGKRVSSAGPSTLQARFERSH